MEKYNLFIDSLKNEAKRLVDNFLQDCINGKESIKCLQSVKDHAKLGVKLQARGFLSCLLMLGEVSEEEMGCEMCKLNEEFEL